MSSKSSLFIAVIATVLSACSGGNAPPPVDPALAAKAAMEAKAAKQTALYEQMRKSGSWDIAVSLGSEVLANWPDSTAAGEVRKTLDETRDKAATIANMRRLAGLWSYTVTAEDGGTQYAAAIASKETPRLPNARLRLVLRQHPKWGQSVYLLLDNATFDCKGACATLPVSFDGAKPQHMKATIPPTGEPALFIDDDKGFIARLEKAKTITVGVKLKGSGEFNAEFEVGGFDPSRLPAKPKK
ncbi:MAG: hypothetical protein DYH18_00540 [Xanthomonadales bacterium PRO7]|jgi:hypothetical protein|nr:hypothetical protein [Xanthomonadales bacterium PRO7]HMM56395.1 hypothetical protein [Rudaea sp.]